VSAEAAALLNGALRTMTIAKVKRVGAVLVAAALLGAGVAAYAGRAESAAPPGPAPEEKFADAEKPMTVARRALDAQGKPLAGADVAVLARPKETSRGGDLSSGGARVLGRAKSGADGGFLLDVQRTSSLKFRQVQLVARGVGHGLGWADLNPDAEAPQAD